MRRSQDYESSSLTSSTDDSGFAELRSLHGRCSAGKSLCGTSVRGMCINNAVTTLCVSLQKNAVQI